MYRSIHNLLIAIRSVVEDAPSRVEYWVWKTVRRTCTCSDWLKLGVCNNDTALLPRALITGQNSPKYVRKKVKRTYILFTSVTHIPECSTTTVCMAFGSGMFVMRELGLACRTQSDI